ncbi:SOS response-associated peptidase [Frankia sp. CNm7]|uniref:Abasic site processing protein n=1 Tax=Frankia nepalensis TaxID=1836974 RepID=A0A937RTD4_9ACTN|nr:SOS response-associated peptidase [Frankia nepalensis]MBL7500127.1 SOS response-associated peptidase [Frankia nepalensis]MBL7511159.1 SOS response-associated peptidase [Frankia nepalensis]MBL7517840.1 SOS response-associated peptidase [Frankia nepalensis]MBL7631571.1 SOS response-associated peptidase [Frankia nepalensis]
MCGRYTQTLSADDLADAMSARDDTGGEVRERYNVAPTTTQPIVTAGQPPASGAPDATPTADTPTGGAAAAGDAARVLRLARWGLVPSWAKDVSIGSRMINARSETVSEKPVFRKAFASRRCLVPVTGFYEWHRPEKKKRGQPYFIHRGAHPGVGPEGPLLAFAGLFEVWRGGEQPLVTYTILTTGPAVGLEFLHDRSPVVLPAATWERWLDPGYQDTDALRKLLAPAPAGVFEAYPVGSEIGNVRNQGPTLVERVELPPGTPDPRTAVPAHAPVAGEPTDLFADPEAADRPQPAGQPPLELSQFTDDAR